MARSERVEEGISHLLAGGSPTGDELSRDLSLLISLMDETYPPVEISPDVERSHLEILLPAAAALRDAPAMPEKRGPTRRKLAEVFAPLSRRIAAGVFAVTTAFSGLAVAGALPPPLQRTAANIGNFVGLHLPVPAKADPPVEVERAPETRGGSITVPPNGGEQGEPDTQHETNHPAKEGRSAEGPKKHKGSKDRGSSQGEKREDSGGEEQGEAEEHVPGNVDEAPDDLGDRQDDDDSTVDVVGEDKVSDDGQDQAGDADAPSEDARVKSEDGDDAPDDGPDEDPAERDDEVDADQA
jgi:hypothetical protein